MDLKVMTYDNIKNTNINNMNIGEDSTNCLKIWYYKYVSSYPYIYWYFFDTPNWVNTINTRIFYLSDCVLNSTTTNKCVWMVADNIMCVYPNVFW